MSAQLAGDCIPFSYVSFSIAPLICAHISPVFANSLLLLFVVGFLSGPVAFCKVFDHTTALKLLPDTICVSLTRERVIGWSPVQLVRQIGTSASAWSRLIKQRKEPWYGRWISIFSLSSWSCISSAFWIEVCNFQACAGGLLFILTPTDSHGSTGC